MTEASDCYKAKYSGHCTLNKAKLSKIHISSITTVANNANALVASLRKGPVAVAVGRAGTSVWQHYKRGTIKCPANSNIDHGKGYLLEH